MNRGLDLGGNPFGEPTRFTIGVGVNPGHLDLDYELRRLDWKVKAGAEYAITQPVFDVAQLETFLEADRGRCACPVVAGIWPLLSYRNAQFMNNEVPGVSVPDEVMERMRIASEKSKEHGAPRRRDDRARDARARPRPRRRRAGLRAARPRRSGVAGVRGIGGAARYRSVIVESTLGEPICSPDRRGAASEGSQGCERFFASTPGNGCRSNSCRVSGTGEMCTVLQCR